VQRGEGQFELGLHARDPGHTAACRPARDVPQESCLADARLAPQDQRRALSGAEPLERAVEALALT
jgi:hypothetical protein